jgi:RNA-binding protein
MALDNVQIRYLRGLSHALRPTVMIGAKGLTDAVVAELDLALAHHELVKVHVAGDDREARAEAAGVLASRTGAEVVQKIGKMICLYRRNPESPGIELPRR